MEVSGPRAEELRDVETKLGRKTPEGLLRWMKEEPARAEAKIPEKLPPQTPELGEKIRRLRIELACLRSIDVQILQQLLAVNEGIESVKWLLEERGGALTSRCSSLTSSQYSLAGSQGASRRGSWNSQQDPTDRLDSISIGSYLDTLADDLDEYSTSEPAATSTPRRHLPTTASIEQDPDRHRDGPVKNERVEHAECQGSGERGNAPRAHLPLQAGKMPNGSLKHVAAAEEIGHCEDKARPVQNGCLEIDKLANQIQLEYDAHWRWVQSQDDVTFL
ncbi:leucine rich adaptor protein 1 [Gastrophryne carolinensis]